MNRDFLLCFYSVLSLFSFFPFLFLFRVFLVFLFFFFLFVFYCFSFVFLFFFFVCGYVYVCIYCRLRVGCIWCGYVHVYIYIYIYIYCRLRVARAVTPRAAISAYIVDVALGSASLLHLRVQRRDRRQIDIVVVGVVFRLQEILGELDFLLRVRLIRMQVLAECIFLFMRRRVHPFLIIHVFMYLFLCICVCIMLLLLLLSILFLQEILL